MFASPRAQGSKTNVDEMARTQTGILVRLLSVDFTSYLHLPFCSVLLSQGTA